MPSEAAHAAAGRAGPVQVVPVSPALGAEVRGVDLSRPLDDAAFAAVRAAWHRHLVLLFRDQRLSDAQFVAFSRRFGVLDIAPPNENGRRFVAGFPEVLVVSNVVEDGVTIGSLGAGEAAWHTDMSYIETPPKASLLYALEVPEAGGDTGFANMVAALRTLPAGLRARIEGRRARHDASTNSVGYLREGAAPVTDVTRAPGACHPLIRTDPEGAPPALYLGRRRNATVEGLPVAESETLLDALWAHATRPRFTWQHRWCAGDLVIWDNRRTMHRRQAFDPGARRIMHRTQVRGGRPA